MNATHYFFATYIFVLLLVLLCIYKRMFANKTAADTAAPEKEKRLFLLYQNLDDMMVSIEEYMEEVKREVVAEREKIALLLEKAQPESKPPAAVQPASVETTLGQDLLAKQEKVLQLKKKGLNIDQIAQEMQISRGEVSLIQGLAKMK